MQTVFALLISLALLTAGFFIVSAFVMLTWNYAIPRVVASVDPKYDEKTFKELGYVTSMVLTVLFGLVFGGGVTMNVTDRIQDALEHM